MVGKNNWEVQLKRGANKVKRYTIKRTSVGVVSAVVAAGLIFGQETSVQADEVTGAESQVTEVSNEELTKTEESTIVDEATPAETAQAETMAEENGAVSETDTDTEESSEPVYKQTEIVAEEVAIEAETIVADTEAVQEVTEVSEESLAKTEEEASVQPQVSTFAATANVSNEDTQLPELISISTDKDVYQAGEDIKVTAIVSENVSLDYVAAMFSRADDSETGPVGFTGTSSQFIQQPDGTYLVEMIISTDEKMPSNTYELWNVSMSDSSGNTETVIWNNDPNNLLGLQFNIVARDVDTQLPELISISTDKDVYQAGEDIKVTAIVSENVSLDYVAAMFSRADDSETGPVGFTGTSSQFIQQPDGTYLVEMIISTDEKMPSNTYELWNVSMSDSSDNTETVIWNNESNNLLGLQFNIVARDVDTQLPELISISTDKDVYQAGEDIKVTAIVSENVSLDYVAAMFSRADDSETGPVGFTGTSSQFIQQPDGTYLVEMIISTDEKMPSNTYELWNVSMSDSSGNTETVIWNNDPNNLLGLQFDIMFGGSGTTIDPEVPEVEEPETPVEPEVPEVEEPETPVEPELPEVEDPETPVEPEVPEVEEPETPVEPEVPEVEEPETPVEPEVPEVEEPETPVEPEVPEVEEPETPVEPELPEVEEPETPVEPEVPEVEEPETPVEPEVEEPETPVEPEVPEVEEPETPVEPEVPEVEEPETPVEPEVPGVEEPETPVEPEVPVVEEPTTPTEPEVPVVEEPETPVEPEIPEVEEPETVVESEVPTNDVKAPVATSEDGVVVAEPITTPAQTVATEGAKAESEVVVAETGSKVAETVLSAEVKAEEASTTVDDQVATLPAAGAQPMSALATGLGVITTALGAVLVRKKK